jgi:hypothetical protein
MQSELLNQTIAHTSLRGYAEAPSGCESSSARTQRLKRILAELVLDIAALKEIGRRGTSKPGAQAPCGCVICTKVFRTFRGIGVGWLASTNRAAPSGVSVPAKTSDYPSAPNSSSPSMIPKDITGRAG